MEERYFIMCRTCKTATWVEDNELAEWIEEHTGHTFGVAPPDFREENEEFVQWLLRFMGWPAEEEKQDG